MYNCYEEIRGGVEATRAERKREKEMHVWQNCCNNSNAELVMSR